MLCEIVRTKKNAAESAAYAKSKANQELLQHRWLKTASPTAHRPIGGAQFARSTARLTPTLTLTLTLT